MIRSDEGITLETSALESLYNGQIILTTLSLKSSSDELIALLSSVCP